MVLLVYVWHCRVGLFSWCTVGLVCIAGALVGLVCLAGAQAGLVCITGALTDGFV